MKKVFLISIAAFCLCLVARTAFSSELLFERSDYYAGRGPVCVISADLDGGGDSDLAVVNNVVSLNDQSVAILFNDGEGSFTLDTLADKYPMNCPQRACAADFDADGDVDLAVADEYVCWSDGSGKISVLDNNGDGSFTYAGDWGLEGGPSGVCAVDLNSDGYPDLAVTLRLKDSVAVLMNDAQGGFAAAVKYVVGDTPYNICSGDLDLDGDTDLAVSNWASDNVSIMMNNGDGTFADTVNYPVEDMPGPVVSEDFNGDNSLDLAVGQGSGNVDILINNGDGTFAPMQSYCVGDSPIGLCAADLDGDGDFDVAAANVESDTVSILLNYGDGTFASADNYAVGDAPGSICSADLDGDCDYDLATANYTSGSVSILKNMGAGSISIPTIDTCAWWKDTLEVPVYASVSSPVCGLQIPISWNGPADCELIEIEYAGTGLATWGYRGDSINNVERFVNFGGAVGEGTPIPAGCNQLIAKLHFVHTGEGYPTEPFELTFDTTTVGPSSLLFYGCEEPVGVSIVPIVGFDTVNVSFGYLPGDANYDCAVNIGDAVYLTNIVFYEGPAPMPDNSGDVNADGSYNLGDAVYLINYVFKGGAAPQCGNVPNDESICCGGGGEKMAKAYRLDSPEINTRFNGEKTTIEIESAFDLYGVQFDIECDENAVITNLTENTQLYEGYSGGQVRVGLIDMKGDGYIPAGQRTILEISGIANILSALGADENGTTVEMVIGSTEKIASLPEAFSLSQNHPNPFNPITTISFNLPEASDVTLDVFNVAGQKVATLADSYLEAGGHTVTWDSKDSHGQPVASGIYLYQIKAGSHADTKKMLLLK